MIDLLIKAFFMKKMQMFFKAIACIFIALPDVCGKAFSQTFDSDVALNVAREQLARAQAFSDKTLYPRTTNPDGTIKRVTASDWTSGFFPGSLWLMYENTKEEIWRTRAEQWTAGLENQQFNTSTHDIGFKLNSSYGAGYRLTGNQKYKAILLQGAKSLSTRYNSKVGCIKSWNNVNYHFPVIIDNMMNLEILFLATKLSGDSSFYKIAVKHALTTIANHFRPDNSSYHLVDYDPYTGKVLSKVTVQGLNNVSDWARGQAWGLYGFTMCYRETRDSRFLDIAKKIADFYITHPNMPADRVPFWDFDACDYRDASAASIASSALLELSQFVPEKRYIYYNFGINTLKTLSSATYMAAVGTNNNFILKHCVGHKPQNIEVNKPLCYADYYFIEALLRHKKPAPFLKAVGGNGKITLSWNKATGASYYSVKRSSVSGGPYTTIASNVTSTKFTNYNLAAGATYYYKVTSWNAMGEGKTSAEAKASTNELPAISISSPTNNAVYIAPATFTIKTNAADADGSISSVKFYIGASFLKTVNTSPYTYTITDLPAGAYSFTAKATDNQGAQKASAPVQIKVICPEVNIRNPLLSKKLDSIHTLKRFNLAPNPAMDMVIIHTMNFPKNQPLQVIVISVTGSVVKTIRSNSSTETLQLDISSLRKGFYIIKVVIGKEDLYKQFLKL